MQKVKLPISVDPVRAAQKHLELDARIPKELLSRLAESTISIQSDINTVFSFEIDRQKLRIFHGKASVAVELLCQRCNEPMIYQCEAEFTYCPVHNQEQENKLPDAYEPIYYDENGEVKLSVTVSHNITRIKQIEIALRESEERYRSLLESSPDPVVVYDMQGVATYVNPAFEQTFGFSCHELTLLRCRSSGGLRPQWPE